MVRRKMTASPRETVKRTYARTHYYQKQKQKQGVPISSPHFYFYYYYRWKFYKSRVALMFPSPESISFLEMNVTAKTDDDDALVAFSFLSAGSLGMDGLRFLVDGVEQMPIVGDQVPSASFAVSLPAAAGRRYTLRWEYVRTKNVVDKQLFATVEVASLGGGTCVVWCGVVSPQSVDSPLAERIRDAERQFHWQSDATGREADVRWWQRGGSISCSPWCWCCWWPPDGFPIPMECRAGDHGECVGGLLGADRLEVEVRGAHVVGAPHQAETTRLATPSLDRRTVSARARGLRSRRFGNDSRLRRGGSVMAVCVCVCVCVCVLSE